MSWCGGRWNPWRTLRAVRSARTFRGAGSLVVMDVPPPDPAKLLALWSEWERGEVAPGKLLSNLKTAGLPDLLEALVAAVEDQG